MDIKQFVADVKAGNVDVEDHALELLDKTKHINDKFNYFNTLSEEVAISQAKKLKEKPEGKLAGVAISVKDAICVKGVESTAGSRILRGYKPPFSATCVEKSVAQGGLIIGKTAQDEFGFGTFATNVGNGLKIPLNPFDRTRACGGSSGGSGGISQKAEFPHVSLGESTGGSIVAPAAFCGVYGLCPTYGRVSRYGVMDYANSLDKIGPMGKDLYGVALLLEVISGHDKKESTSSKKPTHPYTSFIDQDVTGMKIGVIKESFGEGTQGEVTEKTWEAIKKLEDQGATYEEVSLKNVIEYGVPAYYLLACSEASTNLAKYCGIRYGATDALEGDFNEFFAATRSKYFTEEAKRRIMLGTFARMSGYRDAYYIKALKVRTRLIQEYQRVFKGVNALISPTMPIVAPTFDEISKLTPLQHYMMDVLTIGPNLTGMPHMNVPFGMIGNLPGGVMLTTNHFEEGKLIQLASKLK